MSYEEIGLQKSISDSAEMRRRFCRINSCTAPSCFFTPFYLLCFHSSCLFPVFSSSLQPFPFFSSAVPCSGTPTPPLPSAPLLCCLTFVSSAPLCRSHPFRPSLCILAVFSGRDPVPSGALSLLFLFPSAPLVPSPLFPRSWLLSPISCPAPVSSLPTNFCPTRAPRALSFLWSCISLSYFPFSDIVPYPHPLLVVPLCRTAPALLHRRVPYSSPGARPFLPLSLGSSLHSPFVLCVFPHRPPVLPGEGGFILTQSCKGRVVPRAASIALTSFLPALQLPVLLLVYGSVRPPCSGCLTDITEDNAIVQEHAVNCPDSELSAWPTESTQWERGSRHCWGPGCGRCPTSGCGMVWGRWGHRAWGAVPVARSGPEAQRTARWQQRHNESSGVTAAAGEE